MATFSLSDSLRVRDQLEKQQYLEIQKLYQDMAKRAKSQAKKLKGETTSDKLQAAELRKLAKQLQAEAEAIGVRIEESITDTILKTSQAVVGDAQKFNSKIGLTMEGAYRRVPTDIVEVLVSGKLYEGDWSLSKAIWTDIKQTQKDINTVVAEGLALNKSSYDIAKDLEKYVDPTAKKPWDWSKVYPGTKKKVDYNAQRLARTMVGHAYQQSVVATSKNNPFVEGIKWISAHTHSTCDLCNERDGKVFPKDKLPLDHPNGKCSFVLDIPKSMTQIADELADWVQGKPNPGLDEWYQSMWGVLTPVKKDSSVTPTTSTPPPNKWLEIARGQDLKSLKKKGREDMSTLTSSEKKGIKDYTGKSYEKMNSYLRLVGKGYSEEEAKRISKIGSSQLSNLKEAQKGIDKLRTTEPLILRRGSGLGDVAGILPGDYNSNRDTLAKKTIQELNDMLTGSVGTYSSFISTTPDPNGGFLRDVDYIIYAPTGTRGAMVDSISQHSTEDEFLVGPNTRFLVRGVEDSNRRMGSELRIFLELLPD